LAPEADRLRWLAVECAGDDRLFRDVSTLLDARAQMAGSTARTSPPSASFGPYRALHLLGRGGMSAVYLAERADGQFQQKVALKVVAGYLAARDFFRRFEAERQAQRTCLLEMPGILSVGPSSSLHGLGFGEIGLLDREARDVFGKDCSRTGGFERAWDVVLDGRQTRGTVQVNAQSIKRRRLHCIFQIGE
jgi:serine/threonine protein kinase